MLPLIILGAVAVTSIVAQFAKGPTEENKTMREIKERLKLQEEIREQKRVHEEERRKIREERERLTRKMEENEGQLKELTADRREREMREGSLQEELVKANGMLEQERVARESAERGVQPIVWPTSEEFRQALKNVQYSHENFHFAIAGKAGCGKSSLINAFLNLGSKDTGAAPTGTAESTFTIGRYPDPSNKPPRSRTVWFDVPGAGTQSIPCWQYFNKQGLFVFDLIIVAIGDRFEETDSQILQTCRRFNIPSFIVRSKADQHILNSMKEGDPEIGSLNDNKECYLECRKRFIDDTEKMVTKELKTAGLPDQIVYIVSRDTLRKTYRDSLKGLEVSEGVIHEVNLVKDLMQAAARRRCGAGEKAAISFGRVKAAISALTRNSQNHNHGASDETSNSTLWKESPQEAQESDHSCVW